VQALKLPKDNKKTENRLQQTGSGGDIGQSRSPQQIISSQCFSIRPGISKKSYIFEVIVFYADENLKRQQISLHFMPKAEVIDPFSFSTMPIRKTRKIGNLAVKNEVTGQSPTTRGLLMAART